MAAFESSLICTVLNEENTIEQFIDSIAKQSILPNEVIIVDGGSSDGTLTNIKYQILNIKKNKKRKKVKFKVFTKKGNRSVGRNEGIKHASNEIILLTDAGCVLDKNWVKEITKPFADKKTEVVAGYYKGESKSIFQKSLIPYVLVMPDKINEKEFLPATRSMAFKKSIWKKAGGFDEKLSHNEDYAFANRLKSSGAKITFTKNAIANWIPRKNIFQSFKMFFRFALGDIQANLYREKVIYIFLRYIFAAYLLILAFILKSFFLNLFIASLFFGYVLWSIRKNYKYVKNPKAYFYLPLLQFTSDAAVILGTSIGFIQKISIKSAFELILKNKSISLFILFYSILMAYLIQWGIPNLNHPFNYAMDEWHFSQALRTFIKYGTGSISGAASIPLYHIISSIIFLVPFYLLQIVNPFVIKNTLDNLPMQHILFIILRLHTLFYGVLSIILIYKFFKKFLKIFPKIFSLLFIFSPIYLSLTNYYKYDITFTFWIISSLYLLTKYFNNAKFLYFILAGISFGLALSTKFTAAPFVISYTLSYFLFSKKIILKEIFIGVFITFLVFIFVGIPDMIFGKGNYYQLLYSTLIQSPQAGLSFNLAYPSWFFLLFKEFPSIFGYFLTTIFYISIVFWTLILGKNILIKKISEYRLELFIYVSSMLFLMSTLMFGLDGGGNRSLVLLPFMILLSGLFIKYAYNKKSFVARNILLIIMFLGLSLQIIQSLSWISVKFYEDPRQSSSHWILNNIPKNSTIGIENIPIYQMLPDLVLQEFYFKQHDNNLKTIYEYSVVSSQNSTFPKYVIVTNDFDNVNYIRQSPKKELVKKLQKEKYKRIKEFTPNLAYYNLFADKIYFVIANIMPIPVTISIYEKQ
ncbi:MAG: glycosyltransferase [Patescibacteria group bacterium]